MKFKFSGNVRSAVGYSGSILDSPGDIPSDEHLANAVNAPQPGLVWDSRVTQTTKSAGREQIAASVSSNAVLPGPMVDTESDKDPKARASTMLTEQDRGPRGSRYTRSGYLWERQRNQKHNQPSAVIWKSGRATATSCF